MSQDSNDLPEVEIKPFESALKPLQVALDARADDPENDFIRDAVIQRFEFTYELAIKTLRRYLRSAAASHDEVDELTFRELLRRAGDFKLIQGDVLRWLDFRQARTDTVHTYNELRATEVAAVAKDFAADARALYTSLKERIDS